MYHRYFSILHSLNLFLIFHQKWYFPRKVCLSFRLKKKCVGFIFSSTYLCIFFSLKIYLKIFIDDILRWVSLSTGMGPSPRTHGWADLHGGWNDYLDDIYNTWIAWVQWVQLHPQILRKVAFVPLIFIQISLDLYFLELIWKSAHTVLKS